MNCSFTALEILLFFIRYSDGKILEANTAVIKAYLYSHEELLIKTIIGGDEYAILAVNADQIVSDTLLVRFHKFIDYINSRKSRKYRLSISIGYAVYDPNHPCSIDELMSRADISMYEDKKISKLPPTLSVAFMKDDNS